MAPPILFGPRAKPGGVLDIDEPKDVKICVLGVRGRVLYLEVYKNFIDLLLNFLTMRSGAVIKLLREVDTGVEFGSGGSGGILNVYDSLSKLNESTLTVDRDLLLDPIHKLNLTKELQSLHSFEAECCNPECPKYVSCSRLVCKDCTISNHFSCTICNAYFRDNVHTTECYPPWRPWGTHASAPPVLNRYIVLQSIDAITPQKSKTTRPPSPHGGFVKDGVPFMITNDLNISPVTTRSIAKVLKTLEDEDGKTEELDCHELLIGKTEVVFLLGAAMTSLTPMTDIFAQMCNSGNKISASESLSEATTLPQELSRRASSLAKPLEDLMTFVSPLAFGFGDVLQQGTEASQSFSESQKGPTAAMAENSPPTAKERDLSAFSTPQVLPSATINKKSSSVASIQISTQETLKPAEENAPPSPTREKTPLSGTKTRGSASKTNEVVDHLRSPGADASPQGASFSPEEERQWQGGRQPSAELMTSRKSSDIIQNKSIFLPPEENGEMPSPNSSPRRSFFEKYFSSSAVKAPKDKKMKKMKKNEAAEEGLDSTRPEVLSDTFADGKGNQLSRTTTDHPSAESGQSQLASSSHDPSSAPVLNPAPKPKRRSGWFKFSSLRSAKPLPETNNPPTLPSPGEETLSSEDESSEPPAEDDVQSSGLLPAEKPESLDSSEEYKEEEQDQGEATSLPAAVVPNIGSLPQQFQEEATAVHKFSRIFTEEIPLQPGKIEVDFPRVSFS